MQTIQPLCLYRRRPTPIFQLHRSAYNELCGWLVVAGDRKGKDLRNTVNERFKHVIVIMIAVRSSGFQQGCPRNLPIRRLLQDVLDLLGAETQSPRKYGHIIDSVLVRLGAGGFGLKSVALFVFGHLRIPSHGVHTDLAISSLFPVSRRTGLSTECSLRCLDLTVLVGTTWPEAVGQCFLDCGVLLVENSQPLHCVCTDVEIGDITEEGMNGRDHTVTGFARPQFMPNGSTVGLTELRENLAAEN